MGRLFLLLSLVLVGCGKTAQEQSKDDARDGNRLVAQYNQVDGPKLKEMLQSDEFSTYNSSVTERKISQAKIRTQISYGKSVLNQIEVCSSLVRGIIKFASKENVRYEGNIDDLRTVLTYYDAEKILVQAKLSMYESKLSNNR